ncbi:hypothetical protein XELAEV_18001302mg [Xenopus laevis]|nr:hypothetical protein XELAEV_18001302mg [Xenopus laevis]
MFVFQHLGKMTATMAKVRWCFPVIFTMVGLCASMQDQQMIPSQPAGPPHAIYWAPALLIAVLALALYFLLPFCHKPQLQEEEEAEDSWGTCIDALSCCGKGVPIGSMYGASRSAEWL